MSEKTEVTQIETLDSAMINDIGENLWTEGYLMVYRRLKTIAFVEAEMFNDLQSSYIAKKFYCAPYSKFSLLIDLIVTGTPTDILIEVELSDGGAIFRKYMTGSFGDLRYVAASGTVHECIDGECRGHYFRIKATATGVTGADTFQLTVKAEFASM